MTGRRLRVALALGVLVLALACKRSPPAAVPSAGPDKSAQAQEQKPGSAGAVKLCAHGVPADQCTTCNPALAAVFKELGDWCNEHGLPESHCRKCNPKLTFHAPAAPADWCKEHAVPESKCTKCNPALVAKFVAAGDYCREHGFPESVCPYCHPELVEAAGQQRPQFPAPGTTVRLASAETARDVGIKTVRAEKKPFARALDVVGQIAFNQNRLAQLSARGEAVVLEIKVDVGDDVKAGQALGTLASGAVGGHQAQLSSARARVETARAALERERALSERGISSRKEAEEAARELAAAEADFEGARSSLAAAGAVAAGNGGRYVLTSPFAGTVVSRQAVSGRSVSAGQVLIEVADLSTMWAELEIPEAEAGLVRPGQPVSIRLEAVAGDTIAARVARVGASVDPNTRTVRARVELPNRERTLKAGVFIRARIEISAARESVLVPAEAVQSTPEGTLLFVKTGEGVYKPVAAKIGARAGNDVEIVEGIAPGAEVVTTGAFLLKTEILKESIGAGCCDEGGK